MLSIDPAASALVVLDEFFPGAAAALGCARDSAVLTLVLQPAGTARGGATEHERVIIAHAGDAFHGTELDLLLRSNDVKMAVFAGGDQASLIFAARGAAVRGYRAGIVVPAGQSAEWETVLGVMFPGERPALVLADRLRDIWRDGDPSRYCWQEDVKHAALLPTLRERLDPRHTAFILIDLQNDFCGPRRNDTDTYGLIDAAHENACALLGRARASGCMIVHVQAEYGKLFRAPGHPYRYPGAAAGEVVWTASAAEFGVHGTMPPGDVEVCRAGTLGEAFCGIEPEVGEVVLRKHRYSAFVDTGLDVLLRQRGVKTVVIVGVVTNVCVESTARDAAMRDFYVVVAEDAVGVRDSARPRHDAALAEIRGCFGMVVPATRIMEIWQNYRHSRPR
jgi:nicotinamidase-related amidase